MTALLMKNRNVFVITLAASGDYSKGRWKLEVGKKEGIDG